MPTPTGTLQGVAAASWDGSGWQPAGRTMASVGTPTGVLRGVAPFTWDGSAWQPVGRARPGVATPTGTLDGVALYGWDGSRWLPVGGRPGTPTPTGTLQGVAAFYWDGTGWQPVGRAAPEVPTPAGVLAGVAMFSWNGTAWVPAVNPAAAATLDLDFTSMATLDPRVTFARASIGSYFDAGGTLQTAGPNVPRFNYDPVSHLPRGLLLEEARTNIALGSAALFTQDIVVTAQSYVLSFYGTGTVALSGAFTGQLTGTGPFPSRVVGAFTPTVGTLTLTVTGTVQNAQLEAGAFVTSYIPTAGAAVTRAQDVCQVAIGAWFNANAYSLLTEQDTANVSSCSGGISDGTLNGSTYFSGGAFSRVGPGGAGVTGNGPSTAGPVNKVCGTLNSTTIQVANNGTVPVSAAVTAPLQTGATRMSLGMTPWAFDNILDGHMRRVRFWPRVLSNLEMQEETA